MKQQAQHPVWLFDLDNTLHNSSAHVFPHIDRAMTHYIMQHLALPMPAANDLRVHYWRRYGATLSGLIRHHAIDARHFLHHTHRFDNLARLLVFDTALRYVLPKLPGRKIVVSNGPQAYVEAVLAHMKIRPLFTAVFGIERLQLQPKPAPQAFWHLLQALQVPASRCVLVEDTLSNLCTAKKLGMRCVWINPSRSRCPAYVDIRLSSVRQLLRHRHRLVTTLPREGLYQA